MDIATIVGSLTPLILLACPVGMGAMMWMMARGAKTGPPLQPPSTGGEHPVAPASLEILRDEHQRLSAAIDELEQGSPGGELNDDQDLKRRGRGGVGGRRGGAAE